MRINILCEASKKIGLGHLMRCLRLKKILQKLGYEAFIYQRGVDDLSSDYYLEWLEEGNFEKIIADVMFVDSYQASKNFYEKLAQKAKKLIVLDDNNCLDYPKNSIILNGALNAKKLYKDAKNHLLGIEFLITDENFCSSKISAPRIPNKKVQNIFLSFGGGECGAYIKKTLEILCDEPCVFHIISKYPLEMPDFKNCKYYVDISSKQVAQLMQMCDIAIAGGGGMLNELMMSKLASIIVPIASNQIFQAQEWQKKGGIVLSSFDNLAKDFKSLLPFKKRQEMVKSCENIPFGEQLECRLKEIILESQE